jgi:hypothetical protein
MLLLGASIVAAALLLFARITGWVTLVRRYPLGSHPFSRGQPTGGVVIGRAGWNAPPLRVALDDAGFALAPIVPFRWFFHPLYVPWQAVTAVERREYMFFEVVRIRCERDTVVGFLPSAATTAILKRLEARPQAPGAATPVTDRFQEPKT